MKLDVITLDAGKAGQIELSDEIFGIETIRADILQRMVVYQLAKRRAGTHKIKTRNEVARTGKKMYKQKGTGGARHGSRKAAQFVGGAKTHGPVVRSHAFDLPKKVRALALRHALSSKAKDGALVVVDALNLDSAKTSALKARFDKIGLNKALIIADRPDPVGPGKALFGETFYDRVKGALKPGGYATFQTGVPFYQPWEITEALEELKNFFPRCGLYLTVVPTYIGGFMALSWATKGGKPLGTPAGIKKAASAYKRSKLKCDYYNPQVHAAAFALPNWIAKLVP